MICGCSSAHRGDEGVQWEVSANGRRTWKSLSLPCRTRLVGNSHLKYIFSFSLDTVGCWHRDDAWVWSLLPVLWCKSLAHLWVQTQPAPPRWKFPSATELMGEKQLLCFPGWHLPSSSLPCRNGSPLALLWGHDASVLMGPDRIRHCADVSPPQKILNDTSVWETKNKEQTNKNISSLCSPLVISVIQNWSGDCGLRLWRRAWVWGFFWGCEMG